MQSLVWALKYSGDSSKEEEYLAEFQRQIQHHPLRTISKLSEQMADIIRSQSALTVADVRAFALDPGLLEDPTYEFSSHWQSLFSSQVAIQAQAAQPVPTATENPQSTAKKDTRALHDRIRELSGILRGLGVTPPPPSRGRGGFSPK